MRCNLVFQIMDPEDYKSRLVNVFTSIHSTKVDANSYNVKSSVNEIDRDEESEDASEPIP